MRRCRLRNPPPLSPSTESLSSPLQAFLTLFASLDVARSKLSPHAPYVYLLTSRRLFCLREAFGQSHCASVALVVPRNVISVLSSGSLWSLHGFCLFEGDIYLPSSNEMDFSLLVFSLCPFPVVLLFSFHVRLPFQLALFSWVRRDRDEAVHCVSRLSGSSLRPCKVRHIDFPLLFCSAISYCFGDGGPPVQLSFFPIYPKPVRLHASIETSSPFRTEVNPSRDRRLYPLVDSHWNAGIRTPRRFG